MVNYESNKAIIDLLQAHMDLPPNIKRLTLRLGVNMIPELEVEFYPELKLNQEPVTHRFELLKKDNEPKRQDS